jgi:maltose/moltooligosaccharide transporter
MHAVAASSPPAAAAARPALSFWQIWNMCFGFLGIQFGFALQNANVSRIFQTLGASLEQIPLLWIAAPLTGLIVQPIVGYFSDRTWTRLGRRRPYFLAGAILASIALVQMPRSSTLWVAAGLLWILDASINISMEPFRAFVGDQLPTAQRPTGYAMQSFFIGVGAIVASMLPWLLTRAGVSNHVDTIGGIPDTVHYSFYIGAIVLFAAVGWTVLRSREYPPEALRSFAAAQPEPAVSASRSCAWLRSISSSTSSARWCWRGESHCCCKVS